MPTDPPSVSTSASGFRADGCKVFSGLAQARPVILESLGREVTRWLRANPQVRIVQLDTQLCPVDGRVWLAIVVFFVGEETAEPGAAPSTTTVEEPYSLLAHNAGESERMRGAARELFGDPDRRARRARGDDGDGEDDDDGPLDLPPPSDEPLDVRPL